MVVCRSFSCRNQDRDINRKAFRLFIEVVFHLECQSQFVEHVYLALFYFLHLHVDRGCNATRLSCVCLPAPRVPCVRVSLKLPSFPLGGTSSRGMPVLCYVHLIARLRPKVQDEIPLPFCLVGAFTI